MIKKILLSLLLISNSLFAQSSPGFTYGQMPSAGQWNNYFAQKLDYPGASAVGYVLTSNGTTWYAAPPSTGTVTSVGLTLPNIFTVTGSPITTFGTLAATLTSQAQNLVFAAPTGSSGAPTFRLLAVSDVPILNQNTTGTANNVVGIVATANGGTGTTGFLQNGTGAISRTWTSKNQDVINAKDYGVLCDGATDDLANLNAAILAVNVDGGGTLYLPYGNCILSGTVTMRANVHIIGQGPTATYLTVSGTGDGIAMTSPVNSSTFVNTSIENLQIVNSNGANVGAGYDEMGGTFVNFSDLIITGFKYGLILDQSELGTIRRVHFQSQLTAALWLVSGPDHRASALPEFTNRITIQESNFANSGQVCVADDGGIEHTYSNDNFEGCSNPFRVGDQIAFSLENSEFEGASGSIVKVVSTSLTGLAISGSNVISVRNNQMSIPSTFNAIDVGATIGSLIVENNLFSNSTAASVALGTGKVTDFKESGNQNQAGIALFSGSSTTQWAFYNGFYRVNDLQVENKIVMDGGVGEIINGAGTDKIKFTSTASHGSIDSYLNSVLRLHLSDTGTPGLEYLGSSANWYVRTNGTEMYFTVAGDFYMGGIGANSVGHLYANNADIADFDKSGIYNGSNSHLLIGIAAPTIASGFGTSPSIPSGNGTTTFRILIGSGGTDSSGILTMPTVAGTSGWNCHVGVLNPSATNLLSQTAQSSNSATSVTLTNYLSSTGAAAAWPASTQLIVSCFAY
jgi:Pectate lyase superfamily protein